MKMKIMISTCLLLATIVVQATGVLPQGRWVIEKVVIEKNTDENIKTTEYNSATDVKSYISCPKEFVISAKNIVLRYPDGREETAEYTLEGDRLTILAPAAAQSYRYTLNDGVLTLTAAHSYLNNLPSGHTEQISEKWTIVLKK